MLIDILPPTAYVFTLLVEKGTLFPSVSTIGAISLTDTGAALIVSASPLYALVNITSSTFLIPFTSLATL